MEGPDISIIVVDDEPISADEMGDMIRDKYAGQPVSVRVAYNAATVLGMAEREPCDILISDIQMPGMNGLELARELRKSYPDICILYLTGYDDFSYAYEAFQQNADHYLLKTEGDEAVFTAISAAVERLRERRRAVERIREAEERYAHMIPAYRRELLMRGLLGASDEAAPERAEGLDRLYVVVARFDEKRGECPLRTRLIALSAVEKIFADAFAERLLWVESFPIGAELVWILSINEAEACDSALFHLARKARRHLEEQLSLALFFVVADEATELSGLGAKYAGIRSMFSREILPDAAGAAIRRAGAPSPASVADEEKVRSINGLRQKMELCARDVSDGAFDLLRKHARPVMAYISMCAKEPCAAEFTAALTGMLLGYANRNSLAAVVAEAESAALRYTPEYLETLMECLERDSMEQVYHAVQGIARFILEYINSHLGEDISVTALAEASGYSTGYLARVFRQQEGMSIHEYVTMKRMNLARELLCNTNLRVYEIASSCGYDNTTYFIKVFKTNSGRTPQEYKQENASRGRKQD